MLSMLVPVKTVGLRAPRPPIDLDAGGVDDDVVDAVLAQRAVQPPAVAAGLVAAVHCRLLAQAEALTGLGHALQHGLELAGGHREAARAVVAVAEGELPELVGQLQAQVQITCVRRILASKGRRRCSHGCAPSVRQRWNLPL
jgi:hypothetical protein